MIESPLARALLFAPAKLYELAVRARIVAYERGLLKTHRLNAPVISVGNLTVGGTGKTPCVAFLASTLRDAGHHVAILSRGYKRQTTGRVEVSDETQVLCSAAESGDEPFLLAQTCPGIRVIVDNDRYAAGHWLESRAKVSAFILDDAYQHLRLARDLNLLLIDATEPLAQTAMIPFGRLREPLAQLRRADAVIVTRSNQNFDRAELIKTIRTHSNADLPVFFAHHEMTRFRQLGNTESIPVAGLRGKSVAAVSGIAKPDRFNDDLRKADIHIVMRRDFPDHHRYSSVEITEIINAAQTAKAEAIVVTEKDAANLPVELVQQFPLPVFAAQIEFRCSETDGLKQMLLDLVARKHNS